MLKRLPEHLPIYLACGYTDLRKGIDGLAYLVRDEFQLDPCEPALFLFCGRRSDRFKALYWDENGFLLLYKWIESGRLQWPRTKDAVRQLSRQQFRCLLEGLTVDPSKAIAPIKPFVIGRKNFLFANTAKGADVSASIYSLVETAKANQINPYDYLLWILKQVPSLDLANYPERAEQLLPNSILNRQPCF